MRQYKAWGQTQAFSDRRTLTPGGYVVGITKAYTETSKNGYEMLTLELDVAEGDERGIFTSQATDKGWPNAGKYRIMLPETDSPDDMGMRRLKTAIKMIEESNPGYIWDWNEAALRGKKLGTLWRREEYIDEKNGNSHWSTKICALVPADKIRQGDFQMPKDKPLEKRQEQLPQTQFQFQFQPAPQAQDPFSGASSPAYQAQPTYQQERLQPGGYTGFAPVDPASYTAQDPDLPF